MNDGLLERLRQDLTQPRRLSSRHAAAIVSQTERENALAAMAPGALAALEEFELELLLSPLFTPNRVDRRPYEAFLPCEGLEVGELAGIAPRLAGEGLSCAIEEEGESVDVLLPEVVIERFVKLLRLNRAVESGLAALIEATTPPEARHAVMSLARTPDWGEPRAAKLFAELLERMRDEASFNLEKLEFLTDFIRSHPLKGSKDLLRQLRNLIEAYKKDENNPVFNDQLEAYQSGSIRSEHCGDRVKAHRLSMAVALLNDFGAPEET